MFGTALFRSWAIMGFPTVGFNFYLIFGFAARWDLLVSISTHMLNNRRRIWKGFFAPAQTTNAAYAIMPNKGNS